MKHLIHFITFFIFTINSYAQKLISITIDDPSIDSKLISWQEINSKILATLAKNKIKVALFVCGMRVDNKDGKLLLEQWDNENHLICNHSFSHLYFNSNEIDAVEYIEDFERCDTIINKYKNYAKLFRFPYLKEGNTKTKRDLMRNALLKNNYKIGHVSIDASDWYINSKIIEQLEANPKVDLSAYRDYYIRHILDRANYYNGLSENVLKVKVKHTLLLHHSVLTALFLEDIIVALKNENWKFIDASEAFKDEIYFKETDIVPCGESIIWQLVKQSTKDITLLRYPAEDGEYEEVPLQNFIDNYKHKKN